MIVIDIERTTDAIAWLDLVMIDSPDLAGPSTEDQWKATLREIFMENEKLVYR